jgi:hypothetical protein
MNRRLFTFSLALIFSFAAYAQLSPEITSWVINTDGSTGYSNIESNVQQVQYSNDFVYVSATGIPSYNIGPWPMNPSTPRNQNFVFKITRKPVQNTGTPVTTPLGHIGVWSNGVTIFNASDAQSYNNQNVWHRNAFYWEGKGFDECLGHPNQDGEYHHHVNPKCLYDETDSSKHSPIIGYAFDGFPVYGAYAYAKTDGTGNIIRMKSSYKLKNLTTRTNGPDVSAQYPLGCFMEDYEYISGYGDLDEHNGRFCKTPEYPQGTYAYFVTIDKDQTPVYPYSLGLTYYGVVTPGNTGPSSGHVTITETVETYNPANSVEESNLESSNILIYPNPASDFIALFIEPSTENNFSVNIYNSTGQIVYQQQSIQPAVTYMIDISAFSAGAYFVSIEKNNVRTIKQIVVDK